MEKRWRDRTGHGSVAGVMVPDDVAQDLLARSAGWVWLRLFDRSAGLETFDAVAEAAGLRRLGAGWHEIDRRTATRVLHDLLHRDLAYSAELIPSRDAARLATRFVSAVADDSSRFATNSSDRLDATSYSWHPATTHTFDGGVVVTGTHGSAVYWVADED